MSPDNVLILGGVFSVMMAMGIVQAGSLYMISDAADHDSDLDFDSEESEKNDPTDKSSMSNEEFFRRRYMKLPKGAYANTDAAEHYGVEYAPLFRTPETRMNSKGCTCQSVGQGATCRIQTPAQKGQYCFCINVFRRCHAYAYDCPKDKLQMEECQGTCTSDKCCRNLPETWWKSPSCAPPSITPRVHLPHPHGLFLHLGK
ncbi:hypothetical protein BV898_13827 [Hypsibius exemplaris]|uniref:Uncharacterized protein n=1 Tax=Hypsibius exemplaris TaxID=2072580 RepID=A0A1W0W9H3_HYPEX|nr:hypothetical protein BV898_13827 [Hypsibius exemplaris]